MIPSARRPSYLITVGIMALALAGTAAAAFVVPAEIPRAFYRLDARIDPPAGLIEGRETITLKNTSSLPLAVIALDWGLGDRQSCEVSAEGAPLAPRREDPARKNLAGPLFYELARPLPPGASLSLTIAFRRRSDPADRYSGTDWYPRLWWDKLAGHDDYSVALDVPADCALAASGRRDAGTGRFEARGVRTFGIYLAKGETAMTREAEGVLITAVSTEKGRKAAALCLETAADAVTFYKKWIGFYPYPFLSLVPGDSGRWGGYPMAPGLVVIHGPETYKDGEAPRYWQNITAHEIGHQYWGEWILDGDRPQWLWIGMGIHLDTTFMMARGYDPERRIQWMGNYVDSAGMFYDTSLDVTPLQDDRALFDRNNVVIHSKGPALVNALEVVLGPAEFDRLYKNVLRAYGGKRLGWREFQRFCENETGQSLAWFFEAWVRGNSTLCYAVESRDCRPQGDGFRSEIRVRRLGTMAMPVPLRAVFEDGTAKTVLTDRTRTVDTLVFESRSPLKEAVLDPERRLALLPRPVPEIPAEAASLMAWGWDASRSAAVYEALGGADPDIPALWDKLGRGLYEAGRIEEAASCFSRIGDSAMDEERLLAEAWLGLIEDRRGNRDAAIGHYRAALERDKGGSFEYKDLNLRIDRPWLEERLRTPYTPGPSIAIPAEPTAGELEALVEAMNWTREGLNPKAVYDKTPGRDLRRPDFWLKLGLLLFDSGFYGESLDAFVRAAAPEASPAERFKARVWQGHLQDLLGRREAALEAYRGALAEDAGEAMTLSQYGMTLDRRWVETRLKFPFVWKKGR